MKTAVITGASSGLGREFVRQFHSVFPEIQRVWLIARRTERLQELAEQLEEKGLSVLTLPLDLCDTMSFTAYHEHLVEEQPEIALLVNNAGVAGQALFQDITDELWHRYFSVNVDGAYHAIQAVLPAMLHHHEGCIINTSSIWGLRGASCEVTYSCTKAALIGLTRSLAAELAPTHIRVNCVAPGVIRTDMLDALPAEVLPQLAQETPMGRLGTPEDIAHAVAFLASDKADFITGQVLTCDGGFIL